MAKPVLQFQDLLALSDRDLLRAEAERWPAALTLPQAQQLAARAAELSPERPPLRLGVVHTYTSDLLNPWLNLAATLAGFQIETYHAPYGLALDQAETGSALLRHQPDLTLLMLRREDLHPGLAQPITGLPEAERLALRQACLARLAEIVGRFRAQPVGQILLSLLPSTTPATLGLFDSQAEGSEA